MQRNEISRRSQKTALALSKTPIRLKKRTQTMPGKPTAERERTSNPRLCWETTNAEEQTVLRGAGFAIPNSPFRIHHSPFAPASFVAPRAAMFRWTSRRRAAPRRRAFGGFN